jgi:hypothetical protein
MSDHTVPHRKLDVNLPSYIFNTPSEDPPSTAKGRLVELGLFTLARGEWVTVQAITRLIHERGWSHV